MKTVLYLKYNRINGLVGVKTRKAEQDSQWRKKRLVLHVRLGCGSLLLILANQFDLRSVLHGPVGLAPVNQIHVVHGAMNDCKYNDL